MNVQVAVLCDAATDNNGKLSLLGAFDSIYTQQMPAIHPMCAVALRIAFTHAEEGARQLRLNLVDEDGRAIMPAIEMPIQIELPEDAHFVTRNFVVTFQQLKFDQPGLYSMDVSFDDHQQVSIPLFVKYVPAQT